MLIRYKVNPKIIDLIVQLYEKDETTLNLGKMKEIIKITCGIRQGCSISTLLAAIIPYLNMIKKLK